MKKTMVIPAMTLALALAACDQSETTVEADGADAPAGTNTVIVPAEDDGGSSLTIDGADVDATIGDGDINAVIDLDGGPGNGNGKGNGN